MSIYVITHKGFKPNLDNLSEYKILRVGAYKEHKFGDVYDDQGDNISIKNANYCELTGIYWLWRNVNDSFIGIVHYRRYFTHDFFGRRGLTEKEVQDKLNKYDVILPFKAKYNKSIAVDYSETSGKITDLEKVASIIREKYPEYLEDYRKYMNGNTTYLYNMMVMKKNNFNDYCNWLFDILSSLESMIDLNEYNDYQKRIYGFLGERLLNVWIQHNKLSIYEVGVIPTEEKRSIWIKILTGLKRTLLYYVK